MNDTLISIPTNFNMLSTIFCCIIEHWRIPEYEEKLSEKEFEILKRLRECIFLLRDDPKTKVLLVTHEELCVVIKAYEIGFKELKDAGDFEAIVGLDEAEGSRVLRELMSFL